jgi:hypothetical protein
MTFSLPETSTHGGGDGGRKMEYSKDPVNDIISNQPHDILGYDQELVPCESSFTANESQPFFCLPSHGRRSKALSYPISFILSVLSIGVWSIY